MPNNFLMDNYPTNQSQPHNSNPMEFHNKKYAYDPVKIVKKTKVIKSLKNMDGRFLKIERNFNSPQVKKSHKRAILKTNLSLDLKLLNENSKKKVNKQRLKKSLLYFSQKNVFTKIASPKKLIKKASIKEESKYNKRSKHELYKNISEDFRSSLILADQEQDLELRKLKSIPSSKKYNFFSDGDLGKSKIYKRMPTQRTSREAKSFQSTFRRAAFTKTWTNQPKLPKKKIFQNL